MSLQPPGEPWPDTTYGGFSGPGPAPEPPRRWRPRVSRNQLMIGAAAAVVLGLAVGLWARPNLSGKAAATPDEAAAGRAVPIEVDPTLPPGSQPKPAGKLEVLPPGQMAEAARPAEPAPPPEVMAPLPAVPAEAPPRLQVPQPQVPPPQAPSPPAQIGPAPALQAPPVARARASFDCTNARPGAEQMVCSDPALAAEDRELAQAYRRALASGAPPGQIRAEQRDWIAIREDAARYSRRALAQVYAQRIQDLNRLADDAPEGPDEDGPGL